MHLIAPLLGVAIDNSLQLADTQTLRDLTREQSGHVLLFFYVCVSVCVCSCASVCMIDRETAQIMMCAVDNSVTLFLFAFQSVH